MTIRTDLTLELREMFAEEIMGVESLAHDNDGITVTHVKITTDEGAKKIGKPVGNYVTVEIDRTIFENDDVFDRGAKAVGDELKKLISPMNLSSVLVVGLGNRYITPDSIGPKTVSKVTVTRHITKEGGAGYDFSICPVSAIAPGVLGITGIETGEIVQGVKEKSNPSLIIAVDALAARNIDRLGTTVQLSDTGICPGSGVGNNRKELTEKTMGIPVIAIGVPMVVDAVTLVSDMTKAISENSAEKISESISRQNQNMIVTPNDVDSISEKISDIIAEGINMALLS